jgi:hypothetical protein
VNQAINVYDPPPVDEGAAMMIVNDCGLDAYPSESVTTIEKVNVLASGLSQSKD